MKKMIKMMRVMCLTMVVVTAFAMIAQGAPKSVQAAGKKQAALKAYKKFLIKDKKGHDDNRGTYLFALCDVNADGIPELFINHGITGNMELVCTFTGKKVKKILGITHAGINWVNPKKGIISYDDMSVSKHKKTAKWYGVVNGYAKVFAKGKCSIDAEKISGGFNFTGTKYFVNGKSVSKSAFKKRTKNYGSKKVKLKYHAYSDANVRFTKYLK